ncbi:ATP-dependent RNA helicase DRS1 [Capsaspora owczarzaki ATCC 30864]|nr:ATP-dependent RNA helicase DRS1 [Capsaspora owczarzaki ATCC 30864]|eukprot:XP_004364941.2 ATP-dependent RNA helicase DRS1 [Capsaspora owczarzaki ATCC 30864]
MKVDDDEDGNNNDNDDDDEDEDEEDGDSLDGDVMADGSDDEGEADDEQDDDDEEELDEKALAAANNPKLYSDSEDDDDEADEVARPPAKGKKPARKQQSSDDEEDEDSEDSDDSEDDDDDNDDDDDDDSPKDKARAARERERKEKLKAAFFEQAPADIISSKQFTEMNLSRPLLRAISSLNFANATDIQAATIPPALMGRDLVACAKTGSGKTAAFLLPVLERLLYRQKTNPASRVLVLSPTRELAVQCHAMGEKLAKFTDIRMSLICGGFSTKRQQAELRAHPDVIVATPGRLIDHLQNSPGFDLEGIEVLIMDEADRLLEMGFKEEVDEIIRQCSVSRQTMLFSATMTDEVENLIALSMNKPLRVFINKNTDTATNLTQEFVRVRPQREKEKEAIVLAVCKRSFHTKTIVFFRSKQGAHRAKVIFGLFGLKAAELHGDLNQLQRLESLEAFKEGRVDFLLATDLASRGLDIVGVETVVNADMPNTLTQYIHRVGRTARAGRAGRSLSLVCEGERKLLKEIVKHATVPLSSRSIPSDVIEKFSTKIRGASKDIAAIMKAEKEEKMLLQAEMEAAKASNMMEHEKEIYSKPARTWFQDALAKKTSKENSKVAHAGGAVADKGKTQQARPSKRKSEEDLQDQRVQKAMGRSVKKARLGLRPGDAPPPNPNKSPKQAKKSGGAVGFARELTDVSKKSVHGLRTSTNQRDGGKKGGKGGAGASGDRKRGNPKVTNKSFKSKAKFKRR